MVQAAHGPSPLLRRTREFFRRRPRMARALDRLLRPIEVATKRPIFGCPKTLRNGPCGGVRMSGHCEVIPEMMCVWVKAERRARWLPWRGSILRIQPALDWSLKGSSAWMNLFSGRTPRETP